MRTKAINSLWILKIYCFTPTFFLPIFSIRFLACNNHYVRSSALSAIHEKKNIFENFYH
jgi:hypothetical protein